MYITYCGAHITSLMLYVKRFLIYLVLNLHKDISFLWWDNLIELFIQICFYMVNYFTQHRGWEENCRRRFSVRGEIDMIVAFGWCWCREKHCWLVVEKKIWWCNNSTCSNFWVGLHVLLPIHTRLENCNGYKLESIKSRKISDVMLETCRG